MKENQKLPVVGRLVECGKCKRKVLIEYALLGVDHCVDVFATCWACLDKESQKKALTAYKIHKSLEEFQKKSREEEDEEKQLQEEEFLDELEHFYKQCRSGEYIEYGDEVAKRHAYADGDHYLEEYEAQFIEEHDGIQRYLEFLKQTDEYFNQQRYEITARGYKVLIDIYELDEKEPCFIRDDDLPDARLSMSVAEVDIFTIKRNYTICLDRIENPDKPLDFIELCIRNRKIDKRYYDELIEHLIKEKEWAKVIHYGEEVIADTDHPYYDSYPEQVMAAYEQLGDYEKVYEYQKQIFFNAPNTGKQLKSYARTRKYANRVDKGINFKDEVIKYFQDKNDLAHLTQLFLYEGDYQKAVEIAQDIQLDGYSGDYYDPVLVCAYFFTYATLMNEESLKSRKIIGNLFNEMRTTNYANAPYTPLVESVEGKNFSESQKKLFLEKAVEFYKKMFNHIVNNMIRHEYEKAATYCAILKEIYDYLGKSMDFNRYYSNTLEKYHRFRALIAELKKKI